MGRFRIPEIVIGFLVATALWVAVAVIYPKYYGAKTDAIKSAPQITVELEINKRIADYNEALDWLTAFLVTANIALWLTTWRAGVRQSNDMKAAIKETRRIGEAQVRAYVDVRSADIFFISFAGALYRGHPEVQPVIKIVAPNTGQSPARNFVWNPILEYTSIGTASNLSRIRQLDGNWRDILGVGKRWSHFVRQPVKVDSPIQRTNHHEDAETVFG